jgi:hypothetical protein
LTPGFGDADGGRQPRAPLKIDQGAQPICASQIR